MELGITRYNLHFIGVRMQLVGKKLGDSVPLMCITRLFPIMQLKMLHMLGSLHNFRFKENLKTIPVHKIKLGKKKIILAHTM